MKTFALLALIVSVCIGQTLNYSGIDTSMISGFKSDSLRYSKVYNLSQYENLRIDIQADDTSSTGFASDSIKFAWWVETGRPTYNKTNRWDTAWTKITPLSLDTFDMATAANMVVDPMELQTDGTFESVFKKIDTLSVTGVAYQSANFSPDWDVWFKIGFKGLAGNNGDAPLWLRSVVYRRVYTRVGP